MIDLRVEGTERVALRLDGLTLSPVKERRVLRAGGRAIVTATRARIRSQTDMEGKPFAPRKRQPNRQMIRRIARHMRMDFQPGQVTIFIGSGRVGRVAKQLQEGLRQVMNSAKARRELADEAAGAVQGQQAIDRGRFKRKRAFDKVYKRHARAAERAARKAASDAKAAGLGAKEQERASEAARAKVKADFDAQNVAARLPGAMATRKQAKRLQTLGFRKTPQSRLMQWFTRAQAGYLIRKLEDRPPEASWEITVPSRRFLGVPADERHADSAKLRAAILTELNRAA